MAYLSDIGVNTNFTSSWKWRGTVSSIFGNNTTYCVTTWEDTFPVAVTVNPDANAGSPIAEIHFTGFAGISITNILLNIGPPNRNSGGDVNACGGTESIQAPDMQYSWVLVSQNLIQISATYDPGTATPWVNNHILAGNSISLELYQK